MPTKIPWAQTRDGRYSIAEWEIEPARTALLVVDVQRGYIEPSMGVGPALEAYPEIRDYYYPRLTNTVLPNILRLIAFCRQHGLEVVFTRQA